MPLFLELVREVSARDPKLAADALAGLRVYERAARRARPPPKPEVARIRDATLRDHGGEGRTIILVPSLINPPRILDLDEQVSLAGAISRMGRRALLLDWGKAEERSELSVAGHIEELLLPLLRSMGEPVALAGYCLGGTMAIAAANLMPVERVVTLAAPWRFARYRELPRRAAGHVAPLRSGSKIARRTADGGSAGRLLVTRPGPDGAKVRGVRAARPGSADARRFVELEEWANEGEPLPYPAASELVEELFGADRPGSGRWIIGGRAVGDALAMPAVHLTAQRDLIAPPQTVASGDVIAIPSGHVGMIVGSARKQLHEALARFLTPCR